MIRKLTYLLFFVLFLSGCADKKINETAHEKARLQAKGTLLYQNKNIYGFKIAPDGSKMLVVIDDAIVIYDLDKMKPTLQIPEKGINSVPANILWSPDSKLATIIFTGNINRMIFLDTANRNQIYDLYVKNLVDLSWADNTNLLYKVSEDTEAIFQMKVFSREPRLLTALMPGEDSHSKMLLLNGYHGFILKKDDKFTAVDADKLDKPVELANLNFRRNKGFLNRDVLLKDKNEHGLLLKKYGYLTFKNKTFLTENTLVFLDSKGQTITPGGLRGRLLSGGIALLKEDGAIKMYDFKDRLERDLPGNWDNYSTKLHNDYWSVKKAVFLKQKVMKDGKPIFTIMSYKLK